MSVKGIMKRFLGDNLTKKTVLVKRNCIRILDCIILNSGRIRMSEEVTNLKSYSLNKKNVFFGYYDLCQFNSDGSRLLAHVTGQNADPMTDPAEIIWIDAVNGEFHAIAETKAWCWQQGARLRWHPTLENAVLFNDLEGNRYVFRQIHLGTGENTVISDAVYDVDRWFRYGIRVNFERLQRLRPGYGYSRLGDHSLGNPKPADDGVVRIDLASGKETLLFSLQELAKDIPDDGRHHYINHVCFSPSGDQFLFFHIWTKGAGFAWNMRFYVCNTDGTNLRMLEDNVRISHYHWIDEQRIMATKEIANKTYSYVIYDVKLFTKQTVKNETLCIDGHPNIFQGGFITDTYPLKDRKQHIYLSDFSGVKCREIFSIYANPLRYGEHRCDLHPRVFEDSVITIDTTYRHGVRSVVSFTMK